VFAALIQAKIAEGRQRAIVSQLGAVRSGAIATTAAMEDKQYSAAVAAIKAKGILSGKRIERSEVAQRRSVAELSRDELVRIAAGGSPPDDFDPTIN
jgi:hypothetical protein